MYQPCTSTAVNHGEQRGLAADLQSALTRQNTRLPGRSETATGLPRLWLTVVVLLIMLPRG